MAEAPPLIIAIVGAESTGKTTLAAGLADRLSSLGMARVAWVAETLRDWCAAHGRTPRRDEQAGILQAQSERIAEAAANHEVVVCDTTALMTAVYSRLVFGDRSLEAPALAQHRGVTLSLLTALDLPWIADGLQRDGPHVREPVDDVLRELLLANALPFAVIGGQGEQRLAQAMAAVAPLLRA
jgi:nicotinamide riboside kinase